MKIRQSHDHLKFTMENHMHRKTAYKCIETGPRLLWFNIIVDNELYSKPEDIFFFWRENTMQFPSFAIALWFITINQMCRLLTGYYLSGKKKKNEWPAFPLHFNYIITNDDIIFNTQVILLPVLTKWLLQNYFSLSTAAELSWRAKLCCDQMADNFITAS